MSKNSYPQFVPSYPHSTQSYPQLDNSYPQFHNSYPQFNHSYPQKQLRYPQFMSSYPHFFRFVLQNHSTYDIIILFLSAFPHYMRSVLRLFSRQKYIYIPSKNPLCRDSIPSKYAQYTVNYSAYSVFFPFISIQYIVIML